MDSKKALYELTDFGNIRRLYLLLGPACNMHCRHCFQEATKDKGKDFSLRMDDKVWSLLNHFVEYSMEHPYRLGRRFREIIFWGGEPLLHWNLIKDVVCRVYDKYKRLDNVVFEIVSNGVLLTDEMVDFFNKYNVYFVFSYDAPYPFAVRDYVSDEICERVRKLKQFSVNASYNAYNDDILLAERCLRRKFPEARLIDMSALLIRDFCMPADIFDYNWEALKSNFRKLRISAQLGDEFALRIFQMYFAPRGIGIKDKVGHVSDSCSVGKNKIACTLDGKVLGCQNSSIKFGTVNDSLELLYQNSFDLLKKTKSPECSTCRHFDICGAGRCPLDLKDENNRFLSCKDYYFDFYDVIKKEFKNMLSPLSEEDICWYKEQEKIMEKQVNDFLNEGERYKKEGTRMPMKMNKGEIRG